LEKFLAEAKVDTVRLPDDRLALRVETWDRWSTGLIASFNRAGGETSWSLGLHEGNLAGTGQDVGFAYTSTALLKGWIFNYVNTAMLVPGGQLSASYTDLSDGHVLSTSFGLPSRSKYQTWAWLVEMTDQTSTRRILATPSVKDRFARRYGADFTDDALFCYAPWSRYNFTRASISSLLGTDTRIGLTLVAESEFDSAGATKIGFSVDSAMYSAARTDPTLLIWKSQTPMRDDLRLGFALSFKGIDYQRRQNFNQLKWTEDIPLGWQVSFQAMLNMASRGDLRNNGVVQTTASWTNLYGSIYQSASGSWRSFFDGSDPTQGTSSAKLELRWIPSTRFQTIGAISNDAIYGTPIYHTRNQLSLGEDNGLPGYMARSFTGRGRILTSTEIRWTPPLEAFTVAPALAVFAGAGRISDQPGFGGDGLWKTGAGIGLRFGMTRSPTGLVNHLSVSHPVGDKGGSWLISLGAKQSL
jgi:hypothetical protein